MADEIKIPVSIDLSAFRAGLNELKANVDAGKQDIAKALSNIKITVDGKAAGDGIKGLSSTFETLKSAAAGSLNEQKAALASLVMSGQRGSQAYRELVTSIQAAEKEVKDLDDAVKQVDKDTQQVGKGGGFATLKSKFMEGREAASQGGGMFGDIAGKVGQLVSPVGLATAAIGGITVAMSQAMEAGQKFETGLQAVSAVTGLTGSSLQDIGTRAKDLASTFGGSATTQLSAFQGVLSKLGADLADTPAELGKITKDINVLAKAGGLDAAQSMEVLANSILQFGGGALDAAGKAKMSSQFINVLAASARVGAAEIPQVGQAVLVAGVAAKQAKVSFEETNAAIQVLAAGGKVGAEAGTALRNVLGKMAGEDVIPKDARKKLAGLGVDFKIVSDTALPLNVRLMELSKAAGDATAFAKVFGTENAAAASILANGAATIGEWTKEMTGTQDATTQAAKNMNTLSERMNVLKANIENALIGAFQTVAPALSWVIDNLGTIAKVVLPVIAAFATMAVIAKGYALAQTAVSVATGIYETVTGVATVATTAFGIALNTATGGLLIVVGAIVALIAGYALFSKSSEEAAQASLDQAQANRDLIQTQIDDNEAKQKQQEGVQDLVKEYEVLNNKTDRTAKESARLKKVSEELNNQYPDLIDETKSYADNLDNVKKAGELATKSLTDLQSQNEKLQKQLRASNEIIAGETRNVSIAKLQEAVNDIGSFGDIYANKAEDVIKSQLNIAQLYSAKTTAEVDSFQQRLEELVSKTQFGDASKTPILNAVREVAQNARMYLDTLRNVKKETEETTGEDKTKKPPAAPPEPKAPKDDSELQKIKTRIDQARMLEEQKNEQAKAEIMRVAREQNKQDDLDTKIKLLDQERTYQKELLKITTDAFKAEGEGKDIKIKVHVDPKDVNDATSVVLKAQVDRTKGEAKLVEEEAKLREADKKKKEADEKELNKKRTEFALQEQDARIALIKDTDERELRGKIVSIERKVAEEIAKIKELEQQKVITADEGAGQRVRIEEAAARETQALWDEYNKIQKSHASNVLTAISDMYAQAFANMQINIAPSEEEIQKSNDAAAALKKIADEEDGLAVQRAKATQSLDDIANKSIELSKQKAEAEKNYADVSIDAYARMKRVFVETFETARNTSAASAATALENLNKQRGEQVKFSAEITEIETRKQAGVALTEAETRKLASAQEVQKEQTIATSKAQEEAQAQVAASAVGAGLAVLAAGGSAKDALKETAKQGVLGLIEMYRWSIYALVQSVIPPPFGIVAGEVAVQLLKAGATAAIGSFEVGGFTADVGTKQVAGVVHGGEYVANARTTNRERALFEHFERGGTSESYFSKRMNSLRGFETGGFVGDTKTSEGTVNLVGITINYSEGFGTIERALRNVYDAQLSGLGQIKDFSETSAVTITNLYAGLKEASTSLFTEQSKASSQAALDSVANYDKDRAAYEQLLDMKRKGINVDKELAVASEAMNARREEIYSSVTNTIATQAAGLLISGKNIEQTFAGVNETIGALFKSQASISAATFAQTNESMQAVAMQQIELQDQKRKGLISSEAAVEKETELSQQQTELRGAQFQALEAQAATSFAAMVVSGANVGDALKQTAGAVATSLVDMYAPSIIAMFGSIIPPPFGIVAGTVAVQGIKALLSSALSSFDEGGFTADVGETQIAGVVHGREFVANAGMTKRERGLFEFMHAGGTSYEYFTQNYLPQMLAINKINTVVPVDNISMVHELRLLRGAISNQQTQVENYANVNVDLDSKAITRKIIANNNYNLRRM